MLLPATRDTNTLPNPKSKITDGEIRESAHVTIAANGFCVSAIRSPSRSTDESHPSPLHKGRRSTPQGGAERRPVTLQGRSDEDVGAMTARDEAGDLAVGVGSDFGEVSVDHARAASVTEAQTLGGSE